MKNYLDLTVNYYGQDTSIKIQRISKKFPKIIYAVWPKDEDLKKRFENVNFYFVLESGINKAGVSAINHRVVYDYKNEENTMRDPVFEFAVWDLIYN